MIFKKIAKLNNSLETQLTKSTREAYEELLKRIKEKSFDYIFNNENPITTLMKLHDAKEYYLCQNEFEKGAVITKFLYEINNIFSTNTSYKSSTTLSSNTNHFI